MRISDWSSDVCSSDLLALAANFAFWYFPNLPVAMERPWVGGPIQSLSFAPFRSGQSPLTRQYPSPAEIESDLAVLQGKTLSVRTYTAREGLQIVPVDRKSTRLNSSH